MTQLKLVPSSSSPWPDAPRGRFLAPGRGVSRPCDRRGTPRQLLPALAFFALTLALLFAVPPAGAQGGGVIEGQLVPRGGAGAVGGTPVLLASASAAAGTRPDERTAVAGDDGRFRFEGVPLGVGVVHLLRVSYDGGNYFQEVTFEGGATLARAAPIEVYPATREGEVIAVPRLRMILRPDGAGGIGVVENGAFRNGSERAYIGPPGARDATSLRFGLPSATLTGTLQPALGLNRDTLVQVDEPPFFGFATLEAIPPGERQFAYIYRLAPEGGRLDLDRVFPYRTELFQLYVPAGTRLAGAGAGLTDEGETTLGGQQFRLYSLANVPAGGRLTLRLTNLPTGQEGTDLLPWMMALFALVLGIGLIVVYGRRRAPSPLTAAATRRVRTVPGNVPRAGGARRSGGGADSRGGDGVAEGAAARRERLLLELVELDERYEAGGLPEPEYRRRRAARKDELVATLRELAASGPAASGASNQRRRS